MPTIEIHGLSKTIPSEIDKAAELEGRIWKALGECPLREHTFVARGCDHVTDATRGRTMFLRVWMKSHEETHLGSLILCLEPLNLLLQFAQFATQLAPNDDSQEDLFGTRRKDTVPEIGAVGFAGAGRDQPFDDHVPTIHGHPDQL